MVVRRTALAVPRAASKRDQAARWLGGSEGALHAFGGPLMAAQGTRSERITRPGLTKKPTLHRSLVQAARPERSGPEPRIAGPPCATRPVAFGGGGHRRVAARAVSRQTIH